MKVCSNYFASHGFDSYWLPHVLRTNFARGGQFCETLKTRVKLNINFTRPMRLYIY